MSKVTRIETGDDGATIMTVEVDVGRPPPPAGWRRADGGGPGPDGCIVENLLARGLDPSDGLMMFVCHDPRTRRLDLSHEQDTAIIIEHCGEHGITVEPGSIIDDHSDQIVAGGVRIFRDWRMSSAGCTWKPEGPFDRSFMIEDGQTRCRVCGQEVKPA